MTSTTQQAITDIETKIASSPYKTWHIGMTGNVRKTMFGRCDVDEHNGTWIYIVLPSNADAQQVKTHFVEHGVLPCRCSGDRDADTIYAYATQPPI